MFPRLPVRVIEWVKAHKQFRVEFEERGSDTWVFLRKRRKDNIHRVAVIVVDRYHGDASGELVILAQVLCAIGSGASLESSGTFLVSISGGSNTLVDCYKVYLGSGYVQGLQDYPTFDVQLLEHCLQKSAFTVFGMLDTFLRTEFIFTRLKGAEHRDWMQSRHPLRRAIETNDLSLPGLVDVVNNIVGVWLLIFSYLKETGKKDSGDSLVAWLFLLVSISA